MPILVTHHDKQEHSQLDKQGRTDDAVLPVENSYTSPNS
jgi:hypothetical protein